MTDAILGHLRDLGYTVVVRRATMWTGMTATKGTETHVARIDDDGHEAEYWAAVMLAESCGVDLEDG